MYTIGCLVIPMVAIFTCITVTKLKLTTTLTVIIGSFTSILIVPLLFTPQKHDVNPLWAVKATVFSIFAAFLLCYWLQKRIKIGWLKGLIAFALGVCAPFSYILVI